MSRVAFGEFELDAASGELKGGQNSIRLQEKPLKLLLCLLEHPGELVAREELRTKVWGMDVHVDFDDGLNAAAWRLRQALGDSAEAPSYIETVPRKGYRLICKVRPVVGPPPQPSDSFPMPILPHDSASGARLAGPARPRVSKVWLLFAGFCLLGLLGAGALLASRSGPPSVAVLPLRNGTGDAALDYLATGLHREVESDLQRAGGTKVLALAPLAGSGVDLPRVAWDAKAEVLVEWTLLKDGEAYSVSVILLSREGRSLGAETFLVAKGDLKGLHGRVSAFISQKAPRARS